MPASFPSIQVDAEVVKVHNAQSGKIIATDDMSYETTATTSDNMQETAATKAAE
jgi:hypothetical protein